MAQVHTKGSASQPSGGRRARVNGAKEATPTEEFPVEHISIHGHQIGYRRGGEGPVLLLLHGIAGSSRTWVPAMTLLQSDYTVLAPDFLGHGAGWKGAGITTFPCLVRFANSTGEAYYRLDRPYVACHLEFVAGRPGLARTS